MNSMNSQNKIWENSNDEIMMSSEKNGYKNMEMISVGNEYTEKIRRNHSRVLSCELREV